MPDGTTHSWRCAAVAVVLAAIAAACGGGAQDQADADSSDDLSDVAEAEFEADTTDAAPDAPEDVEGPEDGAGAEDAGPEETGEDAAPGDAPPEDAGADEAADAARAVTCADDPPPGADMPDPLPVYGGTCPVLVAGRNTIVSSGVDRQFLLIVPEGLDPSERLPLLFLWHWLGGDAAGFLTTGDVQTGANDARFFAAIPEEKGDLMLKWPYMLTDGEARVAEEVRFADDVLACVAAQFNVNTSCVSHVGVSAGGLWVPQIAQRRARLIASFVALSGGVGRAGDWFNPVRPWTGAAHHMPAIVLWGGPSDFCGLSFSTTSGYLEEALAAGGHFIVECVHNCAHAEPPMEPPPGESKYAALWRFAVDHPFWLEDGESPYLLTGLPAGYPEWCGIGVGGAVPRSGSCAGGILGDCI